MRQKIEVLENVIRIGLELLEAELEDVSGNLGVLGAVVLHQGSRDEDV